MSTHFFPSSLPLTKLSSRMDPSVCSNSAHRNCERKAYLPRHTISLDEVCVRSSLRVNIGFRVREVMLVTCRKHALLQP